MPRQANTKEAVVDDLLDRYLSWREECAALDAAHERWARAARADRALAFAAYRAQLELEEHAAQCYERGIRSAMTETEAEPLVVAA